MTQAPGYPKPWNQSFWESGLPISMLVANIGAGNWQATKLGASSAYQPTVNGPSTVEEPMKPTYTHPKSI